MEGVEKPNFYAILPADVRYDNRLTAIEKLLYAEITALSNKEGYCWANNNYFGELYNKTDRTIRASITNLEKYNYLKRKVIYKKDGKEVEKRLLYPMTKISVPQEENFPTPQEKNFLYNNTSINNKKEYIIDLSKYDIDNESEFKQIIQEWLEYKKEKKQSYKTQLSLNKLIKELVEISNGKSEFARTRVDYCIANNYTGCVFPSDRKKNKSSCRDSSIPVERQCDWSDTRELFDEYYREKEINNDY